MIVLELFYGAQVIRVRELQKNSKSWCFGLPMQGDPALFYAASTLSETASIGRRRRRNSIEHSLVAPFPSPQAEQTTTCHGPYSTNRYRKAVDQRQNQH